MSLTDEQLQSGFPRFRILIMGRRNSGKTTILRKMVGSEDGGLEVRDTKGHLVEVSDALTPSVDRGMSNIEHEITYKSNPRFVFHDSRGIEATGAGTNADVRIEHVWNFISKRSRAQDVGEQLHAIWFCIPLTDERAPSPEFEQRFFERGTFPVPVIAIFTKFEALLRKERELYEEETGLELDELSVRERANLKFATTMAEVLRKTANPPSHTIHLERQNKAESNCEELTEKTYNALQNTVLASIFALAQTNSFRVTCYDAFNDICRRELSSESAIISSLFQSAPNWITVCKQILLR